MAKSNYMNTPMGVPYDFGIPNDFKLGGVALNPTAAKMDANYVRSATYMSNLTRLLDIGLSVFEWKNLPKGVDERMLEWWLLNRGVVLFFQDESMMGSSDAPDGYVVLPTIIAGEFDLYGYPTERTAYSVNGYNRTFRDDDSVLIYNSQLRFPMIHTIQLYAEWITNADIAIYQNIRKQKTSKLAVTDAKTKLSVDNIVQQYDNGVDTIKVTGGFNREMLDVLDLSAPFVARDVMDVRNQLFNQALTFLGVENINTDKKERLVAGEVYGGMGAVEAQRFTRLVSRQHAAEQINEMFGLSIEVDFRSGIYIRTDKEGTVPTDGFGDGTITGEGGYE